MTEEKIVGEFQKELEHLLNKYCWDNRTNIPDYILAQSAVGFLLNLELTMGATMAWHRWPDLSTKLGLSLESTEGQQKAESPAAKEEL